MECDLNLLRRVGAIGDIHAEDLALEQVLDHLAAQNLDAILAVGDIVDGLGDASRCCQLLQEHQVDVVRGNHDRWLLERPTEKDTAVSRWLETLPETRNYRTPSGLLQLCHGLAENDMNRLTEDDYGYGLENNDELQHLLHAEIRYVIAGHTHRRMVRGFEGRLTVINAGTIHREHSPCFAIVDFVSKSASFYDLLAEGRDTEQGEIRQAASHSIV